MTLTNKQIEELLQMLDSKITTINERTKNHTIYIKNLEKEVKLLKEKK